METETNFNLPLPLLKEKQKKQLYDSFNYCVNMSLLNQIFA